MEPPPNVHDTGAPVTTEPVRQRYGLASLSENPVPETATTTPVWPDVVFNVIIGDA
jgi:hypothetical protein